MFFEELTPVLMIVDDHKYEIIADETFSKRYYTLQRDDGYTFIMYKTAHNDWESDSAIRPEVVEAIGLLIDENGL